MKLNEMKLDDLLYMNLHMLSRKLFNTIDYKEVKKEHFTLTEKVKIGSEWGWSDNGKYQRLPIYKYETKQISKNKYYKLKKVGKIVQRKVTTIAVTYKDEYENILKSTKIKNKNELLNNLYNDFYNLSDEYMKELEKYKNFLNEDYLNRVKKNLKLDMEHYITKVLNKNNKFIENN